MPTKPKMKDSIWSLIISLVVMRDGLLMWILSTQKISKSMIESMCFTRKILKLTHKIINKVMNVLQGPHGHRSHRHE